jgi:hypothetical protein
MYQQTTRYWKGHGYSVVVTTKLTIEFVLQHSIRFKCVVRRYVSSTHSHRSQGFAHGEPRPEAHCFERELAWRVARIAIALVVFVAV